MKKTLIMLACAAMAFMVCSCDENEGREDTPKQRRDVTLNKSQKAVNDASNDFSIRLFRNLCEQQKGNLFVSPFSVQMALSIAANGAEGATLSEMMKTLGFEGVDIDVMNSYNKTMLEAFSTLDNTTDVYVANGVWGCPYIEFAKDFKQVCADAYFAEIETSNFETGEAQKAISDWASDKTNGMIKNAGNGLSSELVVAIVNSLYFKGKWSVKFDKKDTYETTFTCADGSEHTVDMMRIYDKEFDWRAGDGFEMLNMPYGNKAFCMTILLPDEGVALDDVLSKVDAEVWNGDNMRAQSCNVRMPRFEMSDNINLKEILGDMGIKRAMTNYAEFHNMVTNDKVLISRISQLSKLKVNEEGTEAAAVTIVGITELTVSGPESHDFFVDRPFAFAIREVSTGAILFMGKVTDLHK